MIALTSKFWDNYDGDGIVTDFSITTPVKDFNPTLVEVKILQADDTIVTAGSSPYEYTINTTTKQVEFTTAPPTGETVYIIPTIPISQLIDFVQGDPMDSDDIEDGYDKLTLIAQEIMRLAGNHISLELPEDSVVMELPGASARALKLVGCDASGNFEMKAIIDAGTSVHSWIADNLLTDTSAADVRATIDVYSESEADSAVTAAINAAVETCFKGSKVLGELFFLDSYKTPAAFNISTPEDFFPAVCLNTITDYTDISSTNWSELVTHLRAKPAYYQQGKAGSKYAFDVTDWDVTTNVGTLTFANTTAENAILAAMAEDNLVHGSYTNWRTVTLAGSIGNIPSGDYAITDVDTTLREITFAVTAANGSGSVTEVASFYPHRVAGSSTTARVMEASDRVLISEAEDGTVISGLRHRDAEQRITGVIGGRIKPSSGGTDISSGVFTAGPTTSGSSDSSTAGPREFTFDSAGSTSPNAAKTDDDKTKPKALGAFLYLWGGDYVA